jgi:hypothetical protein
MSTRDNCLGEKTNFMPNVVPLKPRARKARAVQAAKPTAGALRSPQAIQDAMTIPADVVIDWSQVTRLIGDSPAANGDNNDPVVYSAAVEVQLRRLIAKWGFPRLPLTYGEIQAIGDYCLELHSARGENIAWSPEYQKMVQDTHLEFALEYHPEEVEAIRLAIAGDWMALRLHHTKNDTLTKLGRAWKEFDEPGEE